MKPVSKTTLVWQGPSTIARLRVWHRFEVQSKDGKSHRLRIQEIPEDRFEEVLTFMETYFDKDEPLNRCFQLQPNEETMELIRNERRTILDQKISIIVTADEERPSPKLVACLLLFVTSKDDQCIIDGTESTDQVSEVLTAATGKVDLFEWFDSDHHIKDFGLCVAPQYRCMGIGSQLFSTVSKVAKAFRLPGFGTLITSVYSQAIATKLGFTLLNELELRNYRNKKGQLVFPHDDTGSVLLMGIKYT